MLTNTDPNPNPNQVVSGLAQLKPDLTHLDPDGNFTRVHNTLLSLSSNQRGMRAVYPPEFKTSLVWICYGPGASILQYILQCATEKKWLLSEVEALPPEEFATLDDDTFDELAQEFNLFSALPTVPLEEFPSFDADDLASKFGLTPDL